MSTRHLRQPDICQEQAINELSELCSNEYYLSALGPLHGSRERAQRGLGRIEESVREFEALSNKVSCSACLDAISRQLELQQKALQEIKLVWAA
jgi:hypothetical protein